MRQPLADAQYSILINAIQKGKGLMDENAKLELKKKIDRTARALENANMEVFIAESNDKLHNIISKLLPQGTTVTVGGSMTLFEAGIIELLKSGSYNYLDRYREGITPQEVSQIYREAFFADFYITSTNAITENGELVNVDGNSNRVAAISFGPHNVIVVCGSNKIVKDTNEAVARIKAIAAPLNAARLSCKTPCTTTGKCEACHSHECICCSWSVIRHSRVRNRIKVVLTFEEYGY